MKLFIFGHKQHGKDTMALYLQTRYGINYISSSQHACNAFLFEQMRLEGFPYATPEEAFLDRHDHRKYWYEAILAYNTPDRSRLGREIFAKYSVYCGIRDKSEFDALRALDMETIAIYVDASQRKPMESSESMKLSIEDADIIIDNNGTQAEFFQRIDDLVVRLKLLGESDHGVVSHN